MVKKLKIEKEKLLVFLIFAVLITAVLSIPSVQAALGNSESIQRNFESFVAGLKQTVFVNLERGYEIFFGEDAIKISFSSSSGKGIEDAVLIVAEAMVVIFTLVNVAREGIKSEQVGVEFIEKIAINAVIAMIVVASVNPIMDGFQGIGGILISGAAETMKEAEKEDNGKITVEDIDDQKIAVALANSEKRLEGLDEFVSTEGEDGGTSDNTTPFYNQQQIEETLNVLQYVVWFPMMVCIFLMFSAFFEIKIRYVFAAIAAASIAHEGTRGTGTRFFKKYLGCWVKIAIYFVIAFMANEMLIAFYLRAVESASENVFNINLLFMFLTNLVAGMAMMQTAGLGDEIVGV
jgi:hypothetical protein